MITGVAIENFKGIRHRIELDLRPITLLFGANSAGKSTILHALHYAWEIFERHNLDADQAVSGGKYIDLGGFDGFVHGHDKERVVSLRIDVSLSDNDLPCFDADFDSMSQILEIEFNSFLREAKSASVEVSVGWSNLENCPYVSKTRILLDGRDFAEITANPNLRGIVVSRIVMDHPALTTVRDARGEEGHQAERFENETLLALALAECGEVIAPGDGRRIELSGVGDALPSFDESLKFELEPFSPTGDERADERLANQLNLSQDVAAGISDLILGPCQLVREQLRELRYLGPLRETPPRNYQPPRFARSRPLVVRARCVGCSSEWKR